MAKQSVLRTEDGAPVTDNQNGLYRVMKEDERQRLVENIAGSLAQVSRKDVIERSIEHFRRADAEYGQRVAERVAALR